MKIPHPGFVAGALLAAVFPAIALVVMLAPEADPLPEFDRIGEVDTRKQAFFEYLAPMVEAENARVLEQREQLLDLIDRIEAGQSPGWLERRWLKRLAAEYEVEWSAEAPAESLARLKIRVDRVPVALALVQAAAESGWGRSRFAVEGNNLFGQWCYTPGCGMVPSRRPEGAVHEVAKFPSVRESVRRYINNLNTHRAYAPLREMRARLRENGQQLDAVRLADGLIRYSERREEYVEETKAVIRANRPLIQAAIEGSSQSRHN